MATIHRSVYTGQPEPSPLSMRVPARQETRLVISFRDQNGTVLNTDLGSHLELASRSAGTSLSYALTATDIPNGKAQADIPAGDLSDPNGYNLMLRGHLSGEPMMLARGAVVLQDIGLPWVTGLGAGGGAPGSGAGAFIERIDLVLPRGVAANLLVTIWANEGATVPMDLTGMSLFADIVATAGGTVIDAFAVAPGPSANTVWISLTVAQLDALPDSCWWTLVGTSPGSVGATTFCEGAVTVFGEVSET